MISPLASRLVPRFLLALTLGLLLGSCGGAGTDDQPRILETFPRAGAALDNVVAEFLVHYDGDIEILNPSSVSAFDERGQLPVFAEVDPLDPRVLVIRPLAGRTFIPGRTIVTLGAGLVVNRNQHYDLVDHAIAFTMGEGPNFFVATRGPGAVAEVDRTTFAPVHRTPTPGGVDPVGVLGTQIGDDIRIWVQLATGGGDGRALAWFRPGDGAMTPVALTTAPGGDLEASVSTLDLSRDGRFLLAAWRDTALSRVRLAKIDIRTATEVATAILSPPASPSTAPASLRTAPLGSSVYVTPTSDAGDSLLRISIPTLEESMLEPGAAGDGLPIPAGAGPLSTWGFFVFVAPRPQTNGQITLVNPSAGTVAEDVSEVVGRPRSVLITFDGFWLVEGLADYDLDEGLVLRTRAIVSDRRPHAIVADTGAGQPAVGPAVRVLVHDRTQARFVAVLAGGIVAPFVWNALDIEQEDQDPLLDGIQAAGISTVASDPVAATFVSGIYPP